MLDENLSPVSLEEFKQVILEEMGSLKLKGKVDPIKADIMKYSGWEASAYQSLNEAEKKEYSRINTLAKTKEDKRTSQNKSGQRTSVSTEMTDAGRDYLKSKFPLTNVNYESIYNDLKKIYKTEIQNGKEIIALSPLFAKDGKGNAIYNTNLNAINVSVDAVQSQGFKYFREFTKDVSSINFYDHANNPISFYGANKSGVEKTNSLYSGSDELRTDTKIAELIIANYHSKLGSNKVKDFRLASGQIALENRNVGTMVIYPTKDVLDELRATDDAGIITQEVANAILKNGVSLMSNTKNWNNSLFTRNKRSGLETIVTALDQYDYKDPMGAGDIKIRKGTVNSLAPYTFEYNYNILDEPTGQVMTAGSLYPPINLDINSAFVDINENFRLIAKENAETWNRLYKNSTDAPGVSLNKENPYE